MAGVSISSYFFQLFAGMRGRVVQVSAAFKERVSRSIEGLDRKRSTHPPVDAMTGGVLFEFVSIVLALFGAQTRRPQDEAQESSDQDGDVSTKPHPEERK